jgi:hypothetical protein
MAFPILGTPRPAFFDSSGSPLVSGTLAVLDPADDTNKASYPTYDDAEAATNANVNPIVLDARGEASLWGLEDEDYKLVLKDSAGATIWTEDDVRTPTQKLTSVANGEGASNIGVEDAAGNMAATDVEASLAEIYIDFVAADAVDKAALAAVTNGNGAALVGVEDAGGYFAGFDVETVLAQIGSNYALKALTESVTATNVITTAETGKTFFLNAVGGFTSTLPAPAAGIEFEFIVVTAPTTAYIVTTNAGANVLQGTLLDIVGEQVAITNQDTINFVASTSLLGDSLRVIGDGVNWHCTARSLADGGITTAAT